MVLAPVSMARFCSQTVSPQAHSRCLCLSSCSQCRSLGLESLSPEKPSAGWMSYSPHVTRLIGCSQKRLESNLGEKKTCFLQSECPWAPATCGHVCCHHAGLVQPTWLGQGAHTLQVLSQSGAIQWGKLFWHDQSCAGNWTATTKWIRAAF